MPASLRAWLFLIVVLVFGAVAARADDAAADALKELQGIWLPVEAKIADADIPKETLDKAQMEIKDDKYTVTINDTVDAGMFKFDPKPIPKTMDMFGTSGPNNGKTFLCIYELTGDSLRISYATEGPRPTEYKTDGDIHRLVVKFQRKKS